MSLLLHDCSALLNLLATGFLADIAHATGWQFAICPAVRDEAKKLRDPPTGEMVVVDIAPLVASGLLQILELSGGVERALYIEHSISVDDGEAMSLAIAANRRIDLALDDKKAANHARRACPGIVLWSTPEILRRWAETGRVAPPTLREAILRIEARARFFPSKTHPLAGWWSESKNLG